MIILILEFTLFSLSGLIVWLVMNRKRKGWYYTPPEIVTYINQFNYMQKAVEIIERERKHE